MKGEGGYRVAHVLCFQTRVVRLPFGDCGGEHATPGDWSALSGCHRIAWVHGPPCEPGLLSGVKGVGQIDPQAITALVFIEFAPPSSLLPA